MPIREIRLFGDPVLKTACDPVVIGDPRLADLVQDLTDTTTPPGRAGVAANQIGVGLRAFSYHIDGTVGYLLNPVLVEVSGDPEPVEEGCLSVPGLWMPTPRHPFARARGFDLEGNEVEISGTGVMAQAIQHELDHLDGMLYLDRLDRDTRKEAMRQIRESSWF